MTRYVNHHAMNEVFAVPENEPDPAVRAELLNAIQSEFIERLLTLYEDTAYQLKNRGELLGQIADRIGFSERRIKRMLADYSARTGQWNPLKRRSSEGAIDITHLVNRMRGAGLASQQDPAPQQED